MSSEKIFMNCSLAYLNLLDLTTQKKTWFSCDLLILHQCYRFVGIEPINDFSPWDQKLSRSLKIWFGLLRIYVALAVFQPYRDLEAGDNQSLKIQVARRGIEPRTSCSASQELNQPPLQVSEDHVSLNLFCTTGTVGKKKKIIFFPTVPVVQNKFKETWSSRKHGLWRSCFLEFVLYNWYCWEKNNYLKSQGNWREMVLPVFTKRFLNHCQQTNLTSPLCSL